MEWDDIQFLTFPTILHQIPSAQGHVTHKVSSDHAQTTGSSHWVCPVHQTLAFPVLTL